MVSIHVGLRLDISTKYISPSKFSFNSSRKSLQKIMWKLAPMSRNHESVQEANEFLNKYSFVPILKGEITK